MHKTLRATIAFLLLTALAFANSAAQSALRPIIVLIHGRKQEFRTTESLQREWIGALRDGFEKIGFLGATGDSDVVLVNYQLAFEPDFPASDLCPPGEITARDYQSMGGTLDWLSYFFAPERRGALIRLRDAFAPTGFGRSLVVSSLGDVKRYLDRTSAVACHVDQTVSIALTRIANTGRPIILVAHSLGSLVAYRVLSVHATRNDTLRISHLISIGSQLPLGGLPAEILGHAPATLWPPGVRRWTNIVGLGDFAAFSIIDNKDLQTLEVHEEVVATQWDDRHSAVGYLKNPRTAYLIASAWCNELDKNDSDVTACSKQASRPILAQTGTKFERPPLLEMSVAMQLEQNHGWDDRDFTPAVTLHTPLLPIGGRLEGLPFFGHTAPDQSRAWMIHLIYGNGSGDWSPFLDLGYGHGQVARLFQTDTVKAALTDTARIPQVLRSQSGFLDSLRVYCSAIPRLQPGQKPSPAQVSVPGLLALFPFHDVQGNLPPALCSDQITQNYDRVPTDAAWLGLTLRGRTHWASTLTLSLGAHMPFRSSSLPDEARRTRFQARFQIGLDLARIFAR